MNKLLRIHGNKPLFYQFFRKMKLTILIVTVSILSCLSAQTYSQTTKLTLAENNSTLINVLREIEGQSEFKFFYNEKVDVNRSVSVDVNQKTIAEILDNVLSGTSVTYKVLGRQIALYDKTEMEPFMSEQQQGKKITGKVTDESGAVLPGVSVVIKGTTTGVVTDGNGKYSLANVSEKASLQFAFIGMRMQEIEVAGKTEINVKLTEEVTGIEEVVAIGYGIQKKSSVTGAISSVSGKEISQVPVASFQSALQGKATGVSVVNNGSPGTAPIVRIRGNGSISYAADPLYIIDGTAAADITNFDSKDIESIEILKDASSTAVYGSRAANGVVLITTKKGKKDGKMHISIDSYAGVQSISKTLDLLNTQQYIQYGTALNTNGNLGLPTRFSNMNDPIYTGSTQTYAQTNTDWQKELFKNAAISNTSVSFSTGSEKSTYFASAAYYNQDGIMVGTSYNRGNLRFNSDHDISKHIKFGQTLMYSYSDKDNQKETQGRTNIMHAIRSVPYLPVMDPTKLGGYRASKSGDDGTDAFNPVELENIFESKTSTSKLFGTLYLEIELSDYLKFKTTAGLDYTDILNKVHTPIYNDGFNSSPNATSSRESFTNITKTFTNQLTFNKKFGNHSLNVIAVQEQTAYSTNTMYITGNLPTNAVAEVTDLLNVNARGSLQQNLLLSYLGRVNYDYKNKYLLSVSMRADGSSKFAPGNKWGSFPSASIGWRVKEEPFLQNVSAISDLKIRGGYGELGNNGIGNYDWQAVMLSNTQYVLGNSLPVGTFFNALANKDLKWESSKMTNIGIDVGMLNNKLTFTAEWFNKITDNLILAAPYPTSIGYRAPAYTNIGKMKNYGMEFQAGYTLNTGELKSNFSANLSIVRNNVLNLFNATATIDAGYNQDYGTDNITRTVIGQPIQSFYGYQTDGIFQNEAEIAKGPIQVIRSRDNSTGVVQNWTGTSPGDIRFKDISGPNGKPDGIINSYDRTFLGSYMPKFTYGFNYSGTYKRFDFSLFFQGVYGNKIYNGTKVLTEGMLRLFNAGTAVLDAWTPTNTNTDIPRAVSGDPNNNARISDRFIESGSYLRLKNLSVGYTIPMTTWTHGNVRDVRIYVSGQNLLTFTKYSGYDPEVGAYTPLVNGVPGAPGSNGSGLLNNGIDYGMMPSSRTILGGIQINF
jgi:TonB-linked SusC/RagA family outer membrane protein